MLRWKAVVRNLFVSAAETPNPNFMKFVPNGKVVLDNGTKDFSDLKAAMVSPLAKSLMMEKGVNRIFYGKDYISVGKEEDVNWAELKPKIFEIISHHFDNNITLFNSDYEGTTTAQELEETDETVLFIIEIINARIKPVVQEDGGDIEFIDFNKETGVV